MIEIADGSIATDVYARYLRNEEEFVWTAARVYGACMWETSNKAHILRFSQSASNLTGAQSDYFRAVLSRWPLPPGSVVSASEAAVLSRCVLENVRAGGMAAAVTGMLAAETLYSEWCARAVSLPGVERAADIQAWLEMHTADIFLADRDALAALVDLIPTEISDAQLDAWFSRVLEAEDVFHDASYIGETP
jgi:thiaminase/transcriptional activator TenA